MSTQKEMKVVNTSAANRRIGGHGTDSVVPGQTSVAVAAKAAFGSTQPSNPLTSKPPKKHFRNKFQKKKFSEAFPRNGAPTKKLPSLEACGRGTECAGATGEPVDAAAAPAALGVVPASPDDKAAHKANDASQELVLEKFDKPNLNVDKKEFQNDMKKFGFKGLAASRWA
ncbi:hypothetical protein F4815DRAFT_498671 [Daldinia loculata]|nr:hypothetical protein F4815DRAFT_498671 [Daldinia loculata]